MEHFLSVAKGNIIHFYKGWACSRVSGLTIKYDLRTNEFDGYSVELKELKNAIKVLDGKLSIEDGSIYVVSQVGNKKKKLNTTQSSYFEDVDTSIASRVANKFYDRFVTASKYISHDQTRYFLMGICLTELGGVWATDGRHMIAYHDDENLANGVESIISWNSVLSKLKVESIFRHDNSMEFVTVQGVHYFAEFLKGKFPNCKRLLEDSSSFRPIILSKKVCESLMFAEKFISDKQNIAKVNSKGIETLDDNPYSDKWEIEELFEFACNLYCLNRCVSDINIENFSSYTLVGAKRMMFKNESSKIFFEDAEKVTMLMPFVKH